MTTTSKVEEEALTAGAIRRFREGIGLEPDDLAPDLTGEPPVEKVYVPHVKGRLVEVVAQLALQAAGLNTRGVLELGAGADDASRSFQGGRRRDLKKMALETADGRRVGLGGVHLCHCADVVMGGDDLSWIHDSRPELAELLRQTLFAVARMNLGPTPAEVLDHVLRHNVVLVTAAGDRRKIGKLVGGEAFLIVGDGGVNSSIGTGWEHRWPRGPLPNPVVFMPVHGDAALARRQAEEP